MKIAIPTTEGRLNTHFGHCKQFAMIEVDAQSKEITDMLFQEPPPHEPGVLPRWLHEQGTNVVIAGGLGQHALNLLQDRGITVIVGAQPDTPGNLVKDYLSDTLELAENCCNH